MIKQMLMDSGVPKNFRDRDTAASKMLAFKSKDLNWTPRVHMKNPRLVVYTCDTRPKEVDMEVPGIHWSTSLAHLVSSKPMSLCLKKEPNAHGQHQRCRLA